MARLLFLFESKTAGYLPNATRTATTTQTKEGGTRPTGVVCGDVTCLVFICVCVFGASSTVGTLLDQCIPAG